MKKNYFLFLFFTLFISAFTFSQGSENFTNSNANSNYADNNFVGNNSITWSYVASRNANNDTNGSGISLPALMLRNSSSDSKITSSTISGGIGDFSVKLYKGFTGGGDRQVELFINGVSKGTSTAFDDFNEHVFTVSGINVTGDIVIEIKNTTAKQVIIDDITWTAPSTNPSLSITTPTDNQVFPASTDNVILNFNISNFVLAGKVGDTEDTDGTGDGYILGSLYKNGTLDGTKNIFSTSESIDFVFPGDTYIITAELVDNTGASLSPKVETSITFSVEFPCDISLGTVAKNCNTGGGSNTYDISIPFTGGNTSTYTITADSGTIGGDDPSTTTTGTITISGIAEGTDVAFTLKGDVSNSICDISMNISSPICVALPIVEAFDYTKDTDLVSNALWIDIPTGSSTKNNIQVKLNDDGGGNPILGSFYGPTDLPAFSGNMISMNGAGSDAYIGFEDKRSGTVYASFTFHVTDMTGFTKSAGGYFAILGDSSFRARLWIKDPTAGAANEGLTYNLGLSTTGSTTYHTGFTANLGESVFVVMSYNLDNDEVKLWTIPDASSLSANSAPTADITLTGNGDAINRFTLRQDSTSETPFMDLDELRIGTTWAEVTPDGNTASVGENTIDGFTAYPNPVNNGRLTVKTSNSNKKEVSIYSILGKRVFTQQFSENNKLIDVSQINAGIYIMKVIEGDKIATKKLVIK